jgi:hypothetical protein
MAMSGESFGMAILGESICMAMSGESFGMAILGESIGMAKFSGSVYCQLNKVNIPAFHLL